MNELVFDFCFNLPPERTVASNGLLATPGMELKVKSKTNEENGPVPPDLNLFPVTVEGWRGSRLDMR